MAKIQREKPPQHIVAVDTNILWHQDKKYAASPEFDEFWERNRAIIPLDLRIPETVFGELWFQQTTSALKSLEKVSENIQQVSNVADTAYKHRITPQRLKEQVRTKLTKWAKAKNATVSPVPYQQINWQNLINQAIWREPPFTFDPKNSDNEKGFRDALILETLVSIANSQPVQVNVVFICTDYVLRDSAQKRLEHKTNCLFFEGLKDFESYIQLTQEQLTNQFVRQIQNRAREKFFSSRDKTSLYATAKVRSTIEERFRDDISKPELSEKSPLTYGLLGIAPSQSWTPSKEQWWISNPRFNKLEERREFRWISRVTVARLYTATSASPLSTLSDLLEPTPHRLLLLGFDVQWTATVKSDGRFHELQVREITLEDRSFKVPTADELKRWKLDVAET